MSNPAAISRFTLGSKADSLRLAAAFARHMQAGDVLLLSGGLAAGKTFFVQGAVAALGSADTVSSPSYALANIYESPKGRVVHIDAYRLKTPAEFADLALEDVILGGMAFIEWGGMLEGEFEAYARLDLAPNDTDENARIATLSAEGTRGAELVALVGKDFGL